MESLVCIILYPVQYLLFRCCSMLCCVLRSLRTAQPPQLYAAVCSLCAVYASLYRCVVQQQRWCSVLSSPCVVAAMHTYVVRCDTCAALTHVRACRVMPLLLRATTVHTSKQIQQALALDIDNPDLIRRCALSPSTFDSCTFDSVADTLKYADASPAHCSRTSVTGHVCLQWRCVHTTRDVL
jgi:hypothetical protein